jgi:predicted RNA binding protein YcfA (HicA-like mRNA interferase family)
VPRITPVHWKVLECIFLKAGFVFEGQSGNHRKYWKQGFFRPVIIPQYKEVDVDIIAANMRTAKMTRDDYFKLLKICL